MPFKITYHICRHIAVILSKSTISEFSTIGPGILLSNRGGITIGSRSIGRGVTISNNVTIGMDVHGNTPEIGDWVSIGANSIIYGGIIIGNGVIIKESTVISKNVPDMCIVGGNPGRILKRMDCLKICERDG